jgi:Bacterial regulatory proteins, gntR family
MSQLGYRGRSRASCWSAQDCIRIRLVQIRAEQIYLLIMTGLDWFLLDLVTVDPGSPDPAYSQLAGILRGRIAAGEWSTGPLPSVKDLQETYGVGRGTYVRPQSALGRSQLGDVGPAVVRAQPAEQAVNVGGCG